MVGLYFGSFDPPHIGHLNMIMTAWDTGKYDWVFIIPAYQNPWKPKQTSYDLRCQMLMDILQPFYQKLSYIYCRILGIERTLVNEGTEPITWNVLERISSDYGGSNKIEIITSPETLIEIQNWTNGPEILAKYSFNVLESSHFLKLSDQEEEYQKLVSKIPKIQFTPINDINISSSRIRTMVSEGQIPFPWVSSGVYDIIQENYLYKINAS